MEWQYIGDDQWIFGHKIRGVVRERVAEVYFDEDSPDRAGGWKWMHKFQNGYEPKLRYAIEAAEKAMGLLVDGPDIAAEAIRFIADNSSPLHGEQ